MVIKINYKNNSKNAITIKKFYGSMSQDLPNIVCISLNYKNHSGFDQTILYIL